MAITYDETIPFGPHQVVMVFQRLLNEAGNPIRFTEESGLPQQRFHAVRLLAACGHRRAEVVAVMEEYCRDGWWAEHHPCLSAVVRKADEMRARIEKRQQSRVDEVTWGDFDRDRTL